MAQMDILFIGSVVNFDGSVGSLANHIKLDGEWTTPHQFIYKKREDLFKNEASASVYDVPNLSISKLVDHLARRIDDFRFHIFWHFEYHREEIREILENDPPRLIAISTTLAFVPQFLNDAIQWINAQKRPETKIVIGGKWILDQHKLHGSSRGMERVLRDANPDFAVINNFGEETLHKLLMALRDGDMAGAQSLDNVAYRTADAVVPPSEPAPMVELKVLDGDGTVKSNGHDHDHSHEECEQRRQAYRGKRYSINPIVTEDLTPGQPMIDFQNIGARFLDHVVHVRTCSSCPFKCKFCTFPVLQGTHILFDLDEVMNQLRQLKELSVKHLFIIDDTFNVPKRRFEELMDRMIDADLGMEWVSFYRPQYATDELTRKMYAAGCRMVFCGFESGNDEILQLMDKKVSVAQYLQGLHHLHQAEIISLVSYIIGYPGETYKTAMDTLALIDNPLVDFSRGSLFYYDHNAPVARTAEEWQLTGYGAEWSHRTMNHKEAQKIHFEIVNKTRGIHVPVSDGGAWNLFHLYARGLAWEEIKSHYREFNAIQRRQIVELGDEALAEYRAYSKGRLDELRERMLRQPLRRGQGTRVAAVAPDC